MCAAFAVIGAILLKIGESDRPDATTNELNVQEAIGGAFWCFAAAMFFGRGTMRSIARMLRGEGTLTDVLLSASNLAFAGISALALIAGIFLLGLAITG